MKTNVVCGSDGMNRKANLWNCAVRSKFISSNGAERHHTHNMSLTKNMKAEDIACPLKSR